ncbi:uncharacterized protein [Porites lutea]|uniref:uncharacterized protein n=1 Tax=Porites lutea TaxID=51062 RepID=UPI003CC5F051
MAASGGYDENMETDDATDDKSDTAMEEDPVFGLFPSNGEINNMLEQMNGGVEEDSAEGEVPEEDVEEEDNIGVQVQQSTHQECSEPSLVSFESENLVAVEYGARAVPQEHAEWPTEVATFVFFIFLFLIRNQ